MKQEGRVRKTDQRLLRQVWGQQILYQRLAAFLSEHGHPQNDLTNC